MVDSPDKMPPRANFACLSRKCQQDGAASVYELPVASKTCPVCGSKRIQRLYDSVNIGKGPSRSLNHAIDDAGQQAELTLHNHQDSEVRARKMEAQSLAVPIRQLAPTLGAMGHPVELNAGSRPSPRAPSPAFGIVRGRPPRPGSGTMVDRESKNHATA